MNINTLKTKKFNIDKSNHPDLTTSINDHGFKILNVSGNECIQKTILNTLKHFSFNGKKLNILKAYSCEEAKLICESNPDIILMVIDKLEHLNGSGNKFINFVKKEYDSKNCQVLFMEELIKSSPAIEVSEDNQYEESESDFDFARGRLIDYIRMVLLTCEMENKINSGQILEQARETILGKKNGRKEKSTTISRDKLYAILAHDLKGPIGNIKVLLDFLTNESELLDKKTSKELLLSVRESTNSIHELLDNFLFWTRLNNNDIHYNPVRISLSNIIRGNIALLRSTAFSKNIKISSDVTESTAIFADEYMITTVLRNLIYNAIKFTKNDGEILISAKEQGEFIKVIIKDNGVGISNEDIEKLFRSDIHHSTKGTAKEIGTGLGLILCKDFIEKNGGQIIVESKKDYGSVFSFTIPKWKNISIN